MNHFAIRTVVTALTLAGFAGCNVEESPTERPGLEMRRLQNCDELAQRLEDQVLEQLVRGGGMMFDDVAMESADNAGGGERGPTDFTTTNNQEAGVDEIDMVKTNGTHIFVADGMGVQIVKSWPAEDAEKLATIDLPGWAYGLFLLEDKLVVMSGISNWDGQSEASWMRGYGGSRISVIDVSDPANPVIERERDYEGWVRDARLIDGEIYVVLGESLEVPWEIMQDLYDARWQMDDVPWDASQEVLDAYYDELRDALRPMVQDAMAKVDVASLLPQMADVTNGAAPRPVPMHQCQDLYSPGALTPTAMLSVVHLDIEEEEITSAGILADGWQVYASQDNLYIAQSSQWWWGWETEGVSHIHKFGLHADGAPSYDGTGEIDGWLYDQFAMSEFEGNLRVVTSDFNMWWGGDEDLPEPANNVFVLDSKLDVIGEIRGIAPNESIRSARLMGEKGYMVTFEQIDPFFTLDLSDPREPRVTGELKMPGFSAYLHPMGDDHILAVGMAGLDTGELTGLAINVFDISDMNNPTLVQQHEVGGNGWAWSEAMWDHHAFTFHRDVLTIPAFTESYDEETERWSGFSGTISFSVTADSGIQEIGRVDHRDLVSDSACVYDLWYGWGEEACGWDYGYWYAQVRRSVYIEDNLFTISNYGVKVNDLNDPSLEHTRVLFYPGE